MKSREKKFLEKFREKQVSKWQVSVAGGEGEVRCADRRRKRNLSHVSLGPEWNAPDSGPLARACTSSPNEFLWRTTSRGPSDGPADGSMERGLMCYTAFHSGRLWLINLFCQLFALRMKPSINRPAVFIGDTRSIFDLFHLNFVGAILID